MMKNHQESWKKHGRTIMSDGWRDKANRDLINFSVNSPKGSMFIESLDVSSISKTQIIGSIS